MTRISTSLLALRCQFGVVDTLATPMRARSRSIGSRSLRILPRLIARFTRARIAPDLAVRRLEHLFRIADQCIEHRRDDVLRGDAVDEQQLARLARLPTGGRVFSISAIPATVATRRRNRESQSNLQPHERQAKESSTVPAFANRRPGRQPLARGTKGLHGPLQTRAGSDRFLRGEWIIDIE